MNALESVADTIGHLALIRSKQAKLEAAAAVAEDQVIHRLGVAWRAGHLSILELVTTYEQLRPVAGVGFTGRWQTAMGISWQRLQSMRDNAPNGPHGSWYGTHPLTHRAPRPIRGTCVVYVLYDADLEPCYVGSTEHFTARIAAHRHDGKEFNWWTAFPCHDRDAAYTLESRLLAEHMPYLNRRRTA